MARKNNTATAKAVATGNLQVSKTDTKETLENQIEALLLTDQAEVVVIRQGRSESDVADAEAFPESEFAGMSYDDFCTKIRSLKPGQAILLREGKDFDGKLATLATRIKNAIENRDKRGNLALTKREVKLEQLASGMELTQSKPDGSVAKIRMPFNALRIRSLIGVEK